MAVALVAVLKVRPESAHGPALVPRATDAFMYSVPLREYGFAALRAGEVPLWNPYLLGGQPYLAVRQVALLYPGSWPHLLFPTTTALACTCLLLTGAMQIALYVYYLALPYAAWQWWRTDGGRRPRTAAALCLDLLLLSACASAAQIIPTWELSLHSPRTLRGLRTEAVTDFRHVQLRLILRGLLDLPGVPPTGVFLRPAPLAWLLLLPALASRRRALVALWAGAGVLALVLADGIDTALYRLYFRLPTGSVFRHPVHFLIFTAAAFAVCTATGVQTPVRRRTHIESDTSRWATAGVLAAGSVLTLGTGAWTLGALGTLLVVAWVLRPRQQAVWAVAACGLRTARAVRTIHPATYLPWHSASPSVSHDAVAAFLRQELGHDRFQIYREPREWKNWRFLANWGVIQRLRQLTGYEALTLQRVADSIAFMERAGPGNPVVPFIDGLDLTPEAAYPEWVHLWSVRWIVVDAGEPRWPDARPPLSARWLQERLDLQRVDVGETQLLYNPHALPRVYGVLRARTVPADGSVWDMLAESGFDPAHEVLLENATDVPELDGPGGTISVTFVRDELTHTELPVESVSAHWLVLTDAWFPGWRATVDDRAVEIHPANGVFRAVRVPAGSHTVRFDYRPTSVRVGGLLSLTGFILLVGGLLHRPPRE